RVRRRVRCTAAARGPLPRRDRVRTGRFGRVRTARPDGAHAAGAVRRRGRPVPAVRVVGRAAGLPGGALPRRTGRRARRRRAVAGRRRAVGRGTGQPDAGDAGDRLDGRAGGDRGRGAAPAHRRGGHRRGQRPPVDRGVRGGGRGRADRVGV